MSIASINKVSIRYISGGHSFSEKEIETINAEGRSVEISIITPKSVLVPVENYIDTNRGDYLAAMGLAPSANEVAIEAARKGDMVAVVAVDKAFVESLDKIKVNILLTTPLLDKSIEQGTIIDLVECVAYIRIYDGGLRFAEAVEIYSDADLMATLERLNEVFGIYNMYARAKGDVKRLHKLLKPLFKDLVCE